jgi:hypothetical protein
LKSVIDHSEKGTDYCEDKEHNLRVVSFLSERLLGAKEGTFIEFLREKGIHKDEACCGK